MHSWRYKKLRDERRKAKRKERQSVYISHAKRSYMDKILQGKLESISLRKPLSFRQRMAEKLQSISFRNIFKRK